jgi:DNA-binding SARP family transcriptional activator/Tfp pilus assembly protein PilF
VTRGTLSASGFAGDILEIEFRILGPPELSAGKHADITVSPQLWRVLVSLLVTPGVPVSVDALIDRLWESDPPEKARATVRTYICRISRLLKQTADGNAFIRRHPRGYALAVDSQAVDLHRFRSLRRQADAMAESGDGERAAMLLREADALWRGPALAALPGDWITGLGERLEEERREAIARRIEIELALGHHAELLGELRELSDQQPFDEMVTQYRMIALFRSGRQADALRVYRERRKRLAEEGIEPGPDLAGLHQRILRHDVELAITPVYRLTEKARQPSTLPPDVEDFVGRAHEMRILTEGSERGNAPLVQVIEGTGGIGKTALAVHVAHRMVTRYPDAQLYLSFRAHDPVGDPLDPIDALHRLLRMLEIPAERIPAAASERAELWRTELEHRRAVIILDDATDPEQIRAVVPTVGDCLIVATSRRRCNDWPGLRVLTLDPLATDEATALLMQIIGHSADREPAEVAEAVRLCGRLPLALRVAASRLRDGRISGFGELLNELAELSTGHRNISEAGQQIMSAFEFSYRQLTASQRRLFRHLGIGPCSDVTLSAAIALSGGTARDTKAGLSALLSHHLLEHASSDRFQFHDIIRAYAASRCAQEESESEKRHAINRLIDYYQNAADRVNKILFARHRMIPKPCGNAPQSTPAMDTPQAARTWVEAEWSNVLLTAKYAARHEWQGRCADLTHALTEFLETSGYWNDALAAHHLALQASRDLGDLPRVARAAFDLSFTSLRTGHHEAAERHATEAMTIYRSLGDRHGQAAALDRLGLIYRNSARFRDALAYHQEAMDICRETGDTHGLADALVHSGSALGSLGRYAQETDHLNQALDLYRQVGDSRGEAITLNNLGAVQDDQGYHRDAMESYQKSLAIFRQISGRQNIALLDHNMGRVHEYKGSYDDAIAVYRKVLATYRAIGDLQHQAMALCDIGSAFRSKDCYSEALAHHQQAAALADDIGDLCLHVTAVCGIADAYRGSGSYAAALEQYARVQKLAGEIESPYLKAKALYGMAEAVLNTRGFEAARIYWREALDIFEQLGVPEAATVELRLHGLNTSAG